MEIASSNGKSSQPKRKPRNPDEWKRVKRKRLIIAGESHLSVKGKVVSSKKIGKDCLCKLKCYDKVKESTREMLFNGFYSLKSYDEQNAYLFGLIRKYDIQRKKNLLSERRTCTYKYYIRNQGKEIQVCKLAFARIHAISFRKIRTLTEKLDLNILFPRDGRGKHDNRPKRVSQETLDLIKSHISDVIKSSNLRSYIKEDKDHVMTADLNVSKMYTNFLQIHEPEAVSCTTGQLNVGHIPKVKSWLYRKVFHEEITPKDIQTIWKKLTAFGNAQEECGGPSSNRVGEAPAKKSRRKGTARKIVDTPPESVQFQPKSVHYPILSNYSVPTSVDIQVPRMSSLNPHKTVQHHPMYPQDHSLQDFTHNLMGIRVVKDRMPQMLGTMTHHHHMPSFDHIQIDRVEHMQETSSQQHLDVNEMSNAFLYSSNC